MTTTDDVWAALLENRQRAIRVARARGAHPDEVDDVVQEAMARVASMRDVDIRRVGSLVTVVVANLAVDGHRSRARTSRIQERVTAGVLPEPSPDEAICDAAEARWLWSLRDGLADQDRRVLQLRADGRSIAQAAAELGVTYKAAENALGRARKRLKTAWSATAALLGILWGRRPAHPAAALATAPVALVAAAALAVLSPAYQPQPEPQPDVRPHTAAAQKAAPPAAAPDRTFAPRADAPVLPQVDVPERRSNAAPAPTNAPPVTREVETQPVEVLQHELSPAAVEHHDNDRTFTEEIQRCLHQGPSLDPEALGCAP